MNFKLNFERNDHFNRHFRSLTSKDPTLDRQEMRQGTRLLCHSEGAKRRKNLKSNTAYREWDASFVSMTLVMCPFLCSAAPWGVFSTCRISCHYRDFTRNFSGFYRKNLQFFIIFGHFFEPPKCVFYGQLSEFDKQIPYPWWLLFAMHLARCRVFACQRPREEGHTTK